VIINLEAHAGKGGTVVFTLLLINSTVNLGKQNRVLVKAAGSGSVDFILENIL
jgi:hypothetical protein